MITTLCLMVLVGTLAAALPNTLLEDAKQAAHSASGIAGGREEKLPTAIPLTSRTKSIYQQHVQGVGMTKPSPHNPQYSSSQHMQYQKEDISHQQEGKTVSQYEKGYQYGMGKAALDKHVENALLKSELYGDPAAVNQYRYYGGASERKSNQQITYPAPTKRSLNPSWYSYYGLHSQDMYQPIEENEDVAEDQQEEVELDKGDTAQAHGDWLDSPVLQPSTYPHELRLERRRGYFYPQSYPQQQLQYQHPPHKRESSHWGGSVKDKRFMVSRKHQVNTALKE